jgi:uncharacterized protein (TIGR03435 family)
VIIAFLIVVAALAVAAPQQRFEASSITACPPTTATQTGAQFTLGEVRPVGLRIERTRVAAMCVTVDGLIHMAYNGGHYGHRNAVERDVLGGPSWIRSDRFTVEGSADRVQNPDLMGAMMRSLLEDRFQLRVRRHVDDAPMYALKVAPGGLKVKPLAAGDCASATHRGSTNGTLRIWDACPATMTTVANLFDLDRHVIDKTGVKDRFNIHLEIETAPPGAPTTAAVTKAFEQQLGLTLVSTKGKRSWVQIESVDKPILR